MKDIFNPEKNRIKIGHKRKLKELSRSLNSIKKEHKKAVNSQRETQRQKMLCNDFLILHNESILCLKAMRRLPPLPSIDGKTSCIGMLCERLLESSDNIITQGQLEIIINDVQEYRRLESNELNSLKTLLIAASVNKAAHALTLFDEDQAAQRLSHAIKTLRALNSIDFTHIENKKIETEQTYVREMLNNDFHITSIDVDTFERKAVSDNKKDKDRALKNSEKTVILDPNPLCPKMHILSKDNYSLHISDIGAGFSIADGLDVTRRGGDILRRPQGIFAIIEGEGQPFSITQSPCYYPFNCDNIKRQCEFTQNGAVFSAKKDVIEATMWAALLKRETGEIRKITVKNISRIKKDISVLVYFEPCLREYDEDAAHPAYSRMCMTALYHPTKAVLTFCVRAKDGTQRHMAVGLNEPLQLEYECDRKKILGLNGLDALFEERELNGSTAPSDTACAIRVRLAMQPKSQKELTLLICIGNTQEEAIKCILKNRDRNEKDSIEQSTDIFKNSGICRSIADKALPCLYFPIKCSSYSGSLRRNDLWSFGISGNVSTIALKLNNNGRQDIIKGYIDLYKRVCKSGIRLELIMVNCCDDDKTAEQINDEINEIIEKTSLKTSVGTKGGIFIIDSRYHQKEYIDFILQSASFACGCEMPTEEKSDKKYIIQEISDCEPYHDEEQSKQSEYLEVYCGRFNGKCFEITSRTDSIWTNILANSSFGTMVSNLSLGCTWAIDSKKNRLTPWYNDSCKDNDGEMLILNINGKLYDMIKGSYPIFETDKCHYYGKIEHIAYMITVKVPEKGMFKKITVSMKNIGNTPVDDRVQISYYAEPILGVDRSIFRHLQYEKRNNTVFCNNPWSLVKGTVFFGCDKGCNIWFDMAKFFAGDWDGTNKSRHIGGCVVLTKNVDFNADEFDVVFITGFAKSRRAAEAMGQLALRYKALTESNKDIRSKGFVEANEKEKSTGCSKAASNETDRLTYFDNKSLKQYKTGDQALDVMLNVWTVHQIKSAGINGRIGFHQCSGARSFKEQLQDSIVLLNIDPNYAKRQIFRCAAKQFAEGDVLRCWHELSKEDGGANGVRTLCSGDGLWLIYAVCEYIKTTGDNGILDTQIYYIDGETVKDSEQQITLSPVRSNIKENVFDHCCRAAEYTLSHIGKHGLPLIGNSDPNYGMNKIGEKGRGESVPLALFASIVLERFALLCDQRSAKNDYKREAAQLRRSVDKYAWDGKWYLFGFFDDGTPLGSRKNKECKINSLSQSLVALADMPDKNRVKTALNSCKKHLIDKKNGIVKLLNPPFVEGRNYPGDIMSYPAGISINGGQCTRAACLLAMAFMRMGDIDEAKWLINTINSAKRRQDERLAKSFGVEPYSIPSDIHVNEAVIGKGEFSRYTDSAGWFYRAATELLRFEENHS